ncbi:MAG: M3 family metallopeptidase [Campylobacterota bacterium]
MFIDYKVEDLDQFIPKLQTLLQQNEETIETLLEQKPYSYTHHVKPMEDLEEKLDRFFGPLSNENGVNATDEVQKVYAEALGYLSKYYSKLTQNEKLFAMLKEVRKDPSLNAQQKHLLDQELLGFELSGADLDPKEKKQMEEIDLRLSELGNEFGKNLLQATDAFEMEVDKADLGDMPKDDVEAARDENGRYIFTLQMPSFIAFMTYSPNRSLREKIYKAYTTRAPENAAIIDEILRLREQKATLLGYDNFAQVSIADKTAGSVDEVNGFLDTIAHKAFHGAQKELEALQEFAGGGLASYDFAYYSEKYKKKLYNYSEEQIKPYFEQESVVNGLFALLDELFSIKFVAVDVPAWHEKVKVYDVIDGDDISRLYLDLESRKGKRGGAWMADFQTRFIDAKNDLQPASAFVVCNFAPSGENAPSLLRHDDVVTLFHEMGHALHHILSRVDERGVSGIHGVAWDVVEFPSQFLENFAYEPWVLQRFARHYKTGAAIEQNLLEKIKESKNFLAALGLMRQLEFSKFDFLLHQKLYQGREVQQLLDQVREQTALVKPPRYNRFQHGFAHIFAGGYSAGYYSYKWAEVMSADAFFACVDKDGIASQKARDYKKWILNKGGSENMSTLYHNWLGKEFSTDSLLRLYGIE